MNVKCDKCKDEMLYSSIIDDKHTLKCVNKSILCPNGCQEELKTENQANLHLTKCQHLLNQCQICKLLYKQKDFSIHQEECKTTCLRCNEEHLTKEEHLHQQSCQEFDETCTKCSQTFKRKQKNIHQNECTEQEI